MSKTTSFFEQWENDLQTMREESPADVQGFGNLFQSVMSEGVLTSREKKLSLLALVRQYVAKHARTRTSNNPLKWREHKQILKAAGVAVVMAVKTNIRSRFGLAARYRIPQDVK